MMRRVSLVSRPSSSSFRSHAQVGSGRFDASQQLPSLPNGVAGPLRGISTSGSTTTALSLLSKRSVLPLLRQPARRMATTSNSASGAGDSSKEQHDDQQQQQKNKQQDKDEQQQQQDKDERKEEKEEEKEKEKDDWEKERESRGRGGGGGGYKQEVNAFQKLLAVGIPLTAIGIGVKYLLDMRATGAEDDTLQVDMNAIMSHVFHGTVYNVLDSKKLVAVLGDPLLVEPTKAKFSFSKDSAWVSYPLYAPDGHVCTVTVDLLRIDPKGEKVKIKKPHMWYVAQVEVDLNNGKKMLMSTRMEGIKQPFNVLNLFAKIYQEHQQEFLKQQAAAINQDPSAQQR